MSINEQFPPLLELFIRLRKEGGLSIGLSDYYSLIYALQAGYGVTDYASLARLCCTLWAKSVEEKHIFECYFEQSMNSYANDSSSQILPIPSSEHSNITVVEKPIKNKINYSVVVEIILVIGIGTFVWTSPSTKVWVQKITNKSPSSNPPEVIERPPTLNPEVVETPPIPAPEVIETPPIPAPEVIETPPIPNPATNSPEVVQTKDNKEDLSKKNIRKDNEYQLFWALIFNLNILVIYIFLRLIAKKIGEIFFKKIISNKEMRINFLIFLSPLLNKILDEIQVFQKIDYPANSTIQNYDNDNKITLLTEYLPITYRQMQQTWRYLSFPVKEGQRKNIDIEATINRIGRQGLFLEPVLISEKANRAKLTFLIDQGGSMVPFHSLTNRLVESAIKASPLNNVHTYYFRNCPQDDLYCETFKKALYYLHSEPLFVLIISDAGSARGELNQERIKNTAKFLAQIKQKVRYIAWLNPMPHSRWANTTASEIAHLVPMFELNYIGLKNAVLFLRRHLQNARG